MIAEIGSIIALATNGMAAVDKAVSTVTDIRKQFAKDPAAIADLKAELADLANALVDAKLAQAQLKNELLQVQEQVREREDFALQAARYELVTTSLNGSVYSLKPDADGDEPPHDLCATCFQRRQKSILQPAGFNTLRCPVCGTETRKVFGDQPSVMTASVPVRSPFERW